MANVPARQLGMVIKQALLKRLGNARLDQVLVAQAKRRIEQGGDSTEHYPDLWASRHTFVRDKRDARGRRLTKDQKRLENVLLTRHYRQGGKPMFDTGTHIYQRLSGQTTVGSDELVAALRGPILA